MLSTKNIVLLSLLFVVAVFALLRRLSDEPSPFAHHSPASVAQSRNATVDAAEYVRRVRADPQYDWKQPINLYGVVLDNNNNPVVGADVQFAWNNLSISGTENSYVKTDGMGKFELIGRRGKSLSVEVNHDGYLRTKDSIMVFEFANPGHVNFVPPGRLDPVVFHLWKSNPTINSRAYQIYLPLRPGEHSIAFDPFAIKFDGPNSLIFTLSPGSGSNNACKFSITFPNGKLRSTDEEFPFVAPSDDYDEVIHGLGDRFPNGNCLPIEGRSYFRLNNPRVFGACKFEVDFGNDLIRFGGSVAGIRAVFWVNPSGDPNLEPIKRGSPQELSEEMVKRGYVPEEYLSIVSPK